MGLHNKSRFDRRGPRIIVMVVAIVALVPPLVLLRSALIPTRAVPDSAGESQLSSDMPTSPNTPTCEAGEGCAGDEDTATPQSPVSEAKPTATEDEVLLVEMVNAEREDAGCPMLQLNDLLMASARAHAADMAGRAFAGHVNPDHDGPDARARKTGYWGNVIEVIGAGLPTVDEVFAQWTDLQNPAARKVHAKLTDCSRVSAGVAYHSGRVKPTFGEGIWVLDLGDT